ncbi:uncharacterized protein [Macrobrachium rosenbergii]|uniref:uncharacterized protein n=1 Tax=Macrobrachium rosenbergii TaxID=79674 RepID=UPI0034D710D6
MLTQTGILFLFLACMTSVTDASPVLLVNTDGTLNATYAPYAVLAALGYGAVTLAGVHAAQLWSPIIKSNNIRTVPDPEIAKNNRVIMSNWLKTNVGDPGRSPALESLRNVVAPLVSLRRHDVSQPIQQAIPRPSAPSPKPIPRVPVAVRTKTKPLPVQGNQKSAVRVRPAKQRPVFT